MPVDSEEPIALTPTVYAELRALAGRYFSGRGAHTLQPTALVNEAYLKLQRSGASANDREHFFAIAARAMRQILTDHARRAGAEKRGGGLAADHVAGCRRDGLRCSGGGRPAGPRRGAEPPRPRQ